ncbi:type II secretion system F family protein [Cumulibacter manganitolerans]|uniref:type II secretion system F family protein n=1 Tax=Cumulibacter manganitolerans TaxID=1884992 RepID=UPI001295C192|nr:type II secretion system F family protein [Cumulibacter manganitolerans]
MTGVAVLALVAAALAVWPAPAVGRRSGGAPRWSRWRPLPGRPSVDRPRDRVAASFLLGTAALLVAPPHAAVSAALLSFVLLTSWALSRRGRRRLLEQSADCDTLHALAAELRAGHSLAVALRATAATGTAPLCRGAGRAAHAVVMGDDPAAALQRAAGGPLGDRLGALVRLSGTHGIALAHAVDALAADAEDGLRRRRDLAGLLAGPRATANLLAALPVFGVLMGESIGAHPVRTLLHTPAGAVVLVVGVALAAAGVLWTQALVAKVTP